MASRRHAALRRAWGGCREGCTKLARAGCALLLASRTTPATQVHVQAWWLTGPGCCSREGNRKRT